MINKESFPTKFKYKIKIQKYWILSKGEVIFCFHLNLVWTSTVILMKFLIRFLFQWILNSFNYYFSLCCKLRTYRYRLFLTHCKFLLAMRMRKICSCVFRSVFFQPLLTVLYVMPNNFCQYHSTVLKKLRELLLKTI
jgi:hypothetical protein